MKNTAFVLIHGLGQTPSSWNAVISCFPSDTQIYCPDLCSFVVDNKITYDNLYNAFENYCTGISGGITLCGISLGAVLAVNYAIDHPENVKSLVLTAPQYKIPRFLFGLQAVMFRFMPSETFRAGFNKEQTIHLTNSMRALDFSRTVRDISCHALIVCGQNDSANRKAAEEIASLIPAAELCFINNAGHEVNIDAPKALSDTIKDFLQRQN